MLSRTTYAVWKKTARGIEPSYIPNCTTRKLALEALEEHIPSEKERELYFIRKVTAFTCETKEDIKNYDSYLKGLEYLRAVRYADGIPMQILEEVNIALDNEIKSNKID